MWGKLGRMVSDIADRFLQSQATMTVILAHVPDLIIFCLFFVSKLAYFGQGAAVFVWVLALWSE